MNIIKYVLWNINKTIIIIIKILFVNKALENN